MMRKKEREKGLKTRRGYPLLALIEHGTTDDDNDSSNGNGSKSYRVANELGMQKECRTERESAVKKTKKKCTYTHTHKIESRQLTVLKKERCCCCTAFLFPFISSCKRKAKKRG